MLVDEVQDLSVAQGSLLRRVTKPAIGWSSWATGSRRFTGGQGRCRLLRANADEVGLALPMTVSWRNSQRVAWPL